LLLIPAFIIAGIAARLLAHEQSLLSHAAESTAREQLSAVAEQAALAVETVQNELLRSLENIPEAGREENLQALERSNPLVRNVFIINADGRVLLPDDSLPLTGEQSGFLLRYQALFSDEVAWESTLADDEEQVARPSASLRLRSVMKRAKDYDILSPVESVAGGWIPWYWENRLGQLGWVQPETGGARYGMELEMITVLSELLPVLSAGLPANRRMALVDGAGRTIHQTGGLDVAEGTEPALRVPIGRALPHWEVVLYTPNGTFGRTGRGYALLSAMLVAVLFVSLFGSGILLLREAHRNRREAQQKTTFVSNVSHELKTPLTTIRMYADLLTEGRVSEPEKSKRYLETIGAESRRLTRLVNNVLDFSRLEQNRKKYNCSRFDLRETLEETIQLQRLRIQKAGMELTTDLPEAPAPVDSDPDAIRQVLINLIDNAVKYAASGKTLHIGMFHAKNGYSISVADRGEGIAPRDRSRIFERFYRVDDSLTAESQGCGLGLSIARRMMEDLGGSLSLLSAKGGACFSILIPGELDEKNSDS
jgi:signal transduction histidine kinase